MSKSLADTITLFISERRVEDAASYLRGEAALMICAHDPSREVVTAYARHNDVGIFIDNGKSMLMRYNPPPDEPEEIVAIKELIGSAGKIIIVHGVPPNQIISRAIEYARRLGREIVEYRG